MAVCNLFKPINNKTGNFLLFSQYSSDLTKSATHTDPYRVVPSKFIALNIDYSNWDNDKITKLFQNYYENAVAYFKNLGEFNLINSDSATPVKYSAEISKNIFWRCLFDKKLLNVEEVNVGEETYNACKEMLYCGDINIQTNNIYNSEGYNEIYCYIPTSDNCYHIGCELVENTELDNSYEYNEDYVIGYNETSGIDEIAKIPEEDKPLIYKPKPAANFSFDGGLNSDPNPLTKYEFNTIIVLYDIYVMNEDMTDWIMEYQNIPMGIHFCGDIEEGKISNPNTIFVSNDDIYRAGTSYGLKICMRYTSTNSNNIEHIDITSENDSIFPGFCIAMAEMSKTLDKMNDIITGVYNNSQMSKEVLAIFKNSRTNVPYVKWVGEDPYWFVNGRNTGALATRVAEYNNYTDEQMYEGIEGFEKKLSEEELLKLMNNK